MLWPIDNGNCADPPPFADYQGEGGIAWTGKNNLIPGSLDAKLSGGVRAGVRWAQGATEGTTDVLGANFSAKVEGNISTAAAAGSKSSDSSPCTSAENRAPATDIKIIEATLRRKSVTLDALHN